MANIVLDYISVVMYIACMEDVMTQFKKIDGEDREVLTARNIENQEIINRNNRKLARIAAGEEGATEEEMNALIDEKDVEGA
jgi:hypothetical protein